MTKKLADLTALHITKSHKSELSPKLGKEYGCQTAQLIDKQNNTKKGSS